MKTKIECRGPELPVFPVPESFGTLPEYHKRFDEQTLQREFNNRPCEYQSLGGYEGAIKIKLQADYLRWLTYSRARLRWGKDLSAEVVSRLDYELETIKHLSSVAYVLIIADCVDYVRQCGGLVGSCRGAASGSAVLYALGVTMLDPLANGLIFECFLSPCRIKIPDIAIELDEDSCKKVIEHIAGKYGPDHAALVPPRKRDPRRGIIIAERRLADFLPLANVAKSSLPHIQVGPWLINLAGGVRFDFIVNDSLTEMKRWVTSRNGIKLENGDFSRRPFAALMHPLLHDILDGTGGVFVYAEQIVQTLCRLANFTLAESDFAYKGLKRKNKLRVEQCHRRFIEGCLGNGDFRVGPCADEREATIHAELIWQECLQHSTHAIYRADSLSKALVANGIDYLKLKYQMFKL